VSPAAADGVAVDANVPIASGCPIEIFKAAREEQPDSGDAPALDAQVEEAMHGGSVKQLDGNAIPDSKQPLQEVAPDFQVARLAGELGASVGIGPAEALVEPAEYAADLLSGLTARAIDRALGVPEPAPEPSHATATFAMGCFWGAEVVMGGADGVIATRVGYIDGCEVVQCRYSTRATTFDALLKTWAKGHSVGKKWANKKYASAVLLEPGARARKLVTTEFGGAAVRGLGDFMLSKQDDQMYEFRKKQPKLFAAQHAQLTPQQLTKVNSCIGLDMPYERWLSPIEGDDSLGVDFDSDTKARRDGKRKGAGPAKKKPVSRIKILLLGDEGVGKTELIRRATGEALDAGAPTDPTAGIPKPVMHEVSSSSSDGQKVTLQLWDRCECPTSAATALLVLNLACVTYARLLSGLAERRALSNLPCAHSTEARWQLCWYTMLAGRRPWSRSRDGWRSWRDICLPERRFP
jgi:hypothetical protein